MDRAANPATPRRRCIMSSFTVSAICHIAPRLPGNYSSDPKRQHYLICAPVGPRWMSRAESSSALLNPKSTQPSCWMFNQRRGQIKARPGRPRPAGARRLHPKGWADADNAHSLNSQSNLICLPEDPGTCYCLIMGTWRSVSSILNSD